MNRVKRDQILVLSILFMAAMHGLAFGEECPEWAIDQAEGIAGGVFFDSCFCTDVQVPSLHLNLLLLRGIYVEDDSTKRAVVVGMDPRTHAPITMAKLAPRFDSLSTEVRIDERRALARLEAFWSMDIPPLDFYPPDSALMVLDSLGPEKFWRTNEFVHRVDGVRVMPSVCMAEIDAMYCPVITFAFHKEEVIVSTTPAIDADSARSLARIFLQDSTEYDPATLLDGEAELFIGYGNWIFHGQGWQWSDHQRLFWSCTFHDWEFGEEILQAWVQAHPPFDIEGGLIYEEPTAELYGIDDQEADGDVWLEALAEVGFDVSIHSPSATLSEIQGSLSSHQIFVMETHGRLGGAGGTCPSALMTDFSSPLWFCPEHVPTNDLRWGLLSCCYSGNSCIGDDFKSAFVSRGTDLFQGYEGVADPDLYERYQAYFAERGETFANAHQLAKVFHPPHWQKAVYRWSEGAYNKVRLAPLVVKVYNNTYNPHGYPWEEDPAEAGRDTIRVWAEVTNCDDFRQSPAESVVAIIGSLPSSFDLFTDVAQVQQTLEHGEKRRFYWEMMSGPTDSGVYQVDVKVTSKNLGVAREDPQDSLWHRCRILVEKSGVEEDDNPIKPLNFFLHQNYPNPFNATTVISYHIPPSRGMQVNVAVYNIMGVKVKTLVNRPQAPGPHRVVWDGRDAHGNDVVSGVYAYRVTVGKFTASKKAILIR